MYFFLPNAQGHPAAVVHLERQVLQVKRVHLFVLVL
jgi:hypothetical protein